MMIQLPFDQIKETEADALPKREWLLRIELDGIQWTIR